MPSTYKTPGVYIEEISTLPASIAQVETAIPAFVGFTEFHVKNGEQLNNKPTRIKSLLDFEAYFGKGPNIGIGVDLNADNSVKKVTFTTKFCLYDSMRMFFANGGGPCYIVSIGTYKDTSDAQTRLDMFKAGLKTVRKKDEPTLLLFPDAAQLLDKTKLGSLQQAALKQCNDLQDRFGIFDLVNGSEELSEEDPGGETPELAFRNNVGAQYLKYGAAYYPNLRTTLSFDFDYEDIKDGITKEGAGVTLTTLSKDTTYVEHMNKVVADQGTYKAISIGTKDIDGDYTIDFSSTTLLNEDRFKKKDIYSAYKLISEEYDLSTSAIAKKRIKARVEYIWFMMSSFIKLNLTDNKDEDLDNDTNTNFDLVNIHKAKVKVTESRVYEVLKKLYLYDIKFSSKGTAAANTYTPLAVVNVNGTNVEIPTTSFVYDMSALTFSDADSIYGDNIGANATEKMANAAKASTSALYNLYQEAASIFEDFQAEITNRKSNLETLLRESNPVYNDIVQAVKKEGIVLPPSGAIAGVYAATDDERGVWVAPANRSLASVIGPKINVTAEDQGNLNVDPTSGKSINAIRSFTGRGTLIWGARTLAGNSNEWRYIPVRRLFNMIEESVKKATEFVVFEPNDKNTWVRTKAMIENFLNLIWKAGGLAGAKAEHAYIVKVGLGETMTAQDILEGRMIVEIHLAAVRPAEFIILRFMHKLQES